MKAKDYYSDAELKRISKIVKNFKDKRNYAKSKGISDAMLPRDTTAKKLVSAYGSDKAGLRKRLNTLKRFTSKGDVYKLDSGIRTTKYLAREKKREALSAIPEAELNLKRSKKGLSQNIVDKNANRLRRLKKAKDFENITKGDLKIINASLETPEFKLNKAHIAKQNFRSAIEYGMDKSVISQVFDFDYDEYEKVMNDAMNELRDDEIADMMENNTLVKRIMELYSAKDQNLAFSGDSYEDLVQQLVESMPEIVKHYKSIRYKK